MKLIIFANKDLLTLHAKNQIALLTIASRKASSTITSHHGHEWSEQKILSSQFYFVLISPNE